MSVTTDNGQYFLLVGALILLAAGWLHLLSKTRGLPFRSRCRTMLTIAVRSFVWMLPSQVWVFVLLAWVGGFVGGTLFLGSIGFLGLLWYASTLPVATEAHEGFGDAMLLVLIAFCGLAISSIFGIVTGFTAAERTYYRLTSPPR